MVVGFSGGGLSGCEGEREATVTRVGLGASGAWR